MNNKNNLMNTRVGEATAQPAKPARTRNAASNFTLPARRERERERVNKRENSGVHTSARENAQNARTSANTSAHTASARARFPKKALIAAAAAALLIIAGAIFAIASTSAVQYDEYVPVKITQKLIKEDASAAKVTQGTYLTLEFEELDSTGASYSPAKTYLETFKVEKDASEVSKTVMLSVYKTYKITQVENQFSNWRYTQKTATFTNSTKDGGNDFWTPTGSGSDANLPATLKLGTVDSPALGSRQVTLPQTLTTDTWLQDTADVLNTVDTTELYHITFDTNGHGSAVSSVNVQKGETIAAKKDEDAIKTEAKATDVEGLTLEGWYTDAACKTKFDLTSAVTSTMTLYANWVPTENSDSGLNSYWISPASKYVAEGKNLAAASNAVADGGNYVSATTNVLKSSAEIQADVKKIISGDQDTIDYYTTLMKEDKYHLYTVYKGTDAAEDEDKFVESRIINVGAHQVDSTEGNNDNSALTFQTIHAMPTALAMNSADYNEGGWATADVRETINNTSSGIASTTYLNSAFTNAVSSTKKVSYNGGLLDTDVNTSYTTTYDKFWLISSSEIVANVSGAPSDDKEGAIYGWYSDRTLSSAGSPNAALQTLQKTRHGDISAGASYAYSWMRTPYTTATNQFKQMSPSAALNYSGSASTAYGINPCFSFGAPAVTYDMQGHGDQVEQQVITNGKVAGYTADDITGYDSVSLKFGGWYDNPACSGDAITNFSFTASTTLYANWTPTDTLSSTYWISPGSKYLTQGSNIASASNAVASGGNYVSETTNVLKTANEIKEDVAKIRKGNAATIAYYTKLMKNDKYHLYTKVGTGTALNDYVEFRIINVGEHSAIGDSADGTTLQSDGSALTFQATHALTTSYQHKTTASNEGGWGSSLIRTAMQAGGSIYTQFNTGLTNDIYSVKKFYRQGSTSGSTDNTIKSTTDKMFLIGYQEHVNTIVAGHQGRNVEREGNVYQFWSGIPLNNWTKNQALVSLQQTRAGANVTNSNNSMMWLRSPNAAQSTASHYYCLYSSGGTGSGEFGGATGAANLMMGVAPCFTFGGNAYAITFNSNGHGNQVQLKYVASGDKVAQPTAAEYGTAEGLKLEGWYTDAACKKANKIDFSTWVPTADTTLYANWVPDGDADKYWIAPSYRVTTGNDTTTAYITNSNYVAEAWNVKKSSAEIQADIAVLKRGNVSSNPTYATVLSEYQGFMNNDNYHLYTRYGTGSGSSKNDYVEFRIIQVGEHQIDATEGNNDSSALTFCAVHALSTEYAMNSTSTNVGGWGASALCSTMNSTMLTDNTNYFRAGFANDLMSVEKAYNTGNGTGNATAENKLWILSYTEQAAVLATFAYAPSTSEEGKTYSWFSSKNVNASAWESPTNPCVAYPASRSTSTAATYYTRSAAKSQDTTFITFDYNGALGGTAQANTAYRVVPAFAMGGYLVTFDTQGGSSVDSQLLKSKTTATKPADPVRDGYAFKGWYTDNTYATAFDFSQKIEEDTTVVTKWEAVSDSYWLNYAGATAPETGVLKTRADIQNDLSVLRAGATNANYANVLAEYTSYMNGVNGTASSEVHLYTKLNDGANTTGDAKNNYTEWRIIGLGEHESGDGVNITWQMTHVLPAAQQMNTTDTNVGGYAQSALHTSLGEGGSVYSMFKDAFLEDILAVEKTSGTGNKAAATATTTDKLWLLSAEEVYGATAVSSGSIATEGGTQYAYYTNNSVTKSDATNECLAYRTRSGGLPANQSTEYGAYHEGDSTSTSETYASWWLRSPSAYSAQTFTRIYNDGRLDHNNSSVMRGVALACSMQGHPQTYNLDKDKMWTALKARTA